jgi:hypothetical protein
MEEPPSYRQSARKFARGNRRAMTKAETMVWWAIRDHKLGVQFRRQMPLRISRRTSLASLSRSTVGLTVRRRPDFGTGNGKFGLNSRVGAFFDSRMTPSLAGWIS